MSIQVNKEKVKFYSANSNCKQCTGIYPVLLVGGRWTPSPQCIDEALPDAKAVGGVC